MGTTDEKDGKREKRAERKELLKTRLTEIGLKALADEGYGVEHDSRSLYRITKKGKSQTITFKTTASTWYGFVRKEDDSGWRTLDEVDAVVIASVDDRKNPKQARVHLFDADDIRERIDRHRKERIARGDDVEQRINQPWLSLYHQDVKHPKSDHDLYYVGAGAGNIARNLIATIPLNLDKQRKSIETSARTPVNGNVIDVSAQAKEFVATQLGIDPSRVRITIDL